MLIISVRDGEWFEIGNHVKVHIIGKHANQTRVGIDAPKTIGVHRSKIAAKIRAENGGVIPGREAE